MKVYSKPEMTIEKMDIANAQLILTSDLSVFDEPADNSPIYAPSNGLFNIN